MERTVLRKKESPIGNLRDYLTIFFKHWRKILIIFFSILLTVTLVTFLLPPTYEAKSSLLVKPGREYQNRSEVGTTEPAPVLRLDQEEVINSEIQILTSPDLARRVIEALKIENIYPDLATDPPSGIKPVDAAVDRFQDKLTVHGVRKSGVIEVTFQHKNPQIAAKAVNLLAEFFKEKHVQVFSNPEPSFLVRQVAAFREKLLGSEENLQSFKQKNKVYSLDEQRSLLLKQRTDLQTVLMITQNTVGELEKRLSSLRSQTAKLNRDKSLYTGTERDKIIVDARSKLLALQLSEQELLRKYSESNMFVVDIRKQIQIVRKFLREQEADIKGAVQTGNVVYQEAQKDLVRTEADLSAQRAKLATLSGQLRQLDEGVQTLDSREKEMQNLKRELATNEKNFQIYGDKMQEARIIDDMNRLKLANISVIQLAAVPIQPSKPNKMLNVALAIFFGGLSSIGFALLSEKNSQGLLTPEIAERRLNLAVIAAIPYKE